MSKLLAFALVLVTYGFASGPAAADRTCTPDITWPDVPTDIRAHLVKIVGGPISPEDGPFNPTDEGNNSVPRARFFGACRQSELWTIALERGGPILRLQIFNFSGHTLTDKWTAFVPYGGGFTPAILDRSDER